MNTAGRINTDYASKMSMLSADSEKNGALLSGMEQIIAAAASIDTADSGSESGISDCASLDQLREDVPFMDFDREALMTNAPDVKNNCFNVPQVVE